MATSKQVFEMSALSSEELEAEHVAFLPEREEMDTVNISATNVAQASNGSIAVAEQNISVLQANYHGWGFYL